MKAIIFGANGQDGFFLSELLKTKNISVACISRSKGDLVGDVADYDFVLRTIKNYKPNYIFHFAANSTINHDSLFENHQAISTGTLNILEAVRLYALNARVFLSGSALQFKNDGAPINEASLFEATSAYSVARIQSLYAARYYRTAFKLNIFFGYLFNHDSSMRSEVHVNQKIVCAVKRIAKGRDEKIELGNINIRKEFNYAGDIVEAIWVLINQNNYFEAVIGSGKSYSIIDWLEYCFKKINKNWEDFVVLNPDCNREYKILVSDPALIKSLGWAPKVNFNQLADMMLS
jgi:GDPmannose 4,6-dehydratase